MITWLNHVSIAVPDLDKAAARYERLGGRISEPQIRAEEGVCVVVVSFPNSKIELLHPIRPTSPIADYLARHPRGGIHHLCFEVEDINAATKLLESENCRILGAHDPETGTLGKPVIFVDPDDFQGALVEFQQM
ncbi:methylmalonyl-CoA epimerase [Rhizobium sp. CF142]|uniref:methylmalonyl-CoA epimerase n=1 Tax=Rhizobium sp. CF142 TaxID=1144314 RepID=UPI00026EFEDC|nr:methylmalonyl-CoA epimerase [Rhizobium sp. CF142]EJJ29264.1 methylmalonyl-CoA epimerase [Rhizobium sp. CF142]